MNGNDIIPNDPSANGRIPPSRGSNIPTQEPLTNKQHRHDNRDSKTPAGTPPQPNIEMMQIKIASETGISLKMASDALIRADFDAEKAINQLHLQSDKKPVQFKRHSSSNDLSTNRDRHDTQVSNRPASTPPQINVSTKRQTSGSPKECAKETIFIDTGIATWNQIHSILTKAVKNAGIKCYFEMVMPKNEKGAYKGFAFVWFSDVRISNRLVGRNDDGTERFQIIDDPNWTIPEEYAGKDFSKVLEEKLKDVTSWATQSDIHDVLKKAMKPPKIKLPLPTSLPIPPIRYNKNQLASIEKAPEIGKIKITYAMIRRHREGRTTNVIFGDVPDWMTENIISKHFSRYVTVDGNTYPSVKLIERRDRRTQKLKKVAYVYFSSTGLDGQTAAIMSFDFTFNHEKYGKVKLHFVHPYDRRTSRPSRNHSPRVPFQTPPPSPQSPFTTPPPSPQTYGTHPSR